MIALGICVAAASGVATMLLATRRLRRRLRAWIAWQSSRFSLRVETPGKTPVRIGTSVGEAHPIESVEALLDDGNYRPVRLPPGMQLRGIAAPAGPFEIAVDEHYWILDAEGEEVDESGRTVLVLEKRPEGYELSRAAPPMSGDIAAEAGLPWWTIAVFLVAAGTAIAGFLLVAAIGLAVAWLRVLFRVAALARVRRPPEGHPQALDADPPLVTKWLKFPRPLWLQRMHEPGDWLLPAKKAGVIALVYDLGDPHGPPGIDARDDLLAGVAPLLADAIWLGTDLRAELGIPGVVGRSRIQRSAATLWSVVEDSAVDEAGDNPVVFGEALPDLDREGYSLRIRATRSNAPEVAVSGPLPGLAHALVLALEKAGWCRRVEPPRELPLPRVETIPGMLRVFDVVTLAAMKGRGNAFLPSGDSAWWSQALDLARDFAEKVPDLPQALLLWAVVAMYAHEVKMLDAERRENVLAKVKAVDQVGHPVRLLAPAILARLGDVDAARWRIEVLRKEIGAGPYREVKTAFGEWLDRVEASCDD